MSRVACVWADVGDTDTWYEATHVPNVVAKLGITARNAKQAEDQLFKEVTGIDGKYMTVYDLPDGDDVKAVDAQIQPDTTKLPKASKIDTRIYRQDQIWHGDEWRGRVSDIQMLLTVLWQPVPAKHDDFVSWLSGEFIPNMLESPEVLRTRIFKLQHASVFADGKMETKSTENMYQYMTIWEFETEELPWEIMVFLGSSERWRYYVDGGHLMWQIAQFNVGHVYPEEEEEEEEEEHEEHEEENVHDAEAKRVDSLGKGLAEDGNVDKKENA